VHWKKLNHRTVGFIRKTLSAFVIKLS